MGRKPQSCYVSFPCIRALYNASWQDFSPARTAPLSIACSPILNGRAEQSISGGWFSFGKEHQADSGLIQSVWVLLDVIDRVEYHSPGDFPAKVIFFSGGEIYEIVYVAVSQEALITHALKQDARQDSRRIVLVEEPDQIPLLDFPSIAGFCTVSSSGQVLYYQRTNGGT